MADIKTEIVFAIPGEPRPKGRPRPRASGSGYYIPRRTMQYQEKVAYCFLERAGGRHNSLKGRPVHVGIQIHVPPRKKEQREYGTPAPIRMDIDNVVKSILDGLNGVAYHDDRQVYFITAKKEYSPKWKTIVSIIYPKI